MTATDELRRMLDERGVEWSAPNSIMSELNRDLALRMTYWGDTFQFCAIENYGGHFSLSDLTPQQAIEATLGRGTCHIVKTWSDSDYVDGWRYRCSECMCFIPVIERDPETGDVISAANYCPNCGRRVVAGDGE